MPVKQNICLVGPSGYRKTSLWRTLAIGLHRATGKRTRWYNVDGGCASADDLVLAGIADKWEISRATYPFELLVDVSQGYWPEDVNDPYSRRQPPYLLRYKAVCDKCSKALYDSDKPYNGPPITCPTDKVPVRLQILRELNPKNDMSNIGLVVHEGLTGYGEGLMDNMADRSARGERMGEDIAVKFKDGNLDVGGSSRSSYGIGQRRLKRAVEDAKLLDVWYMLWTALKDRGEDSERRVPVFGPKLPGHAAADDAPRWFGPTLQMSIWPNGKDEETRVYLERFKETWNPITKDVEHICNSRVPSNVIDLEPKMPPYFVFEKSDETLLWRIVQAIEAKQAKAAEIAKTRQEAKK